MTCHATTYESRSVRKLERPVTAPLTNRLIHSPIRLTTHDERSQQGIENEIISGAMAQGEGVVDTRERVGGLLKDYYRQAA